MFNRATMVVEAVGSVLAQDDVEVEVVVVDDGSTDDTSLVIDRLAAGDARVIALHQVNGGPARARNVGVAASSHEWVTFLDSDDLMTPGRLRMQLDAFEQSPEVAMVFGQEEVEVFEGVELPAIVAARRPPDEVPPWYVMSMMVRRTMFDELGRFDEALRIGEDIDLFGRLVARGYQHTKIEQTLVIRRLAGDNLVYGAPAEGALMSTLRRYRGRASNP